MSEYSMEYLNGATSEGGTLIGYTDKRGPAWHYDETLQGEESNHYPFDVPMGDVERRLFDWEAVEVPLSYIDPDSDSDDYRSVNGYKGVMHSKTHRILGVHSEGYKIHQYSDTLLTSVSEMLGSNLFIGSAGLLRYGGQAWVSVEMEDTLESSDVPFRPQLLCASSHDGSLAVTVKPVVTVTVCDNTFRAALGEKGNAYTFRHTSQSRFDVERAREATDLIGAIGAGFAAQVEKYVETAVPEHTFIRFLEKFTPIPEEEGRGKTVATTKRDTLLDLWGSDPRVAPWQGTAWGVIQAVNTYNHWESRANKQDGGRIARNMSATLKGTFETADERTIKILEEVMA